VSATQSLAAECSSDPNECTPKKLCEAATQVQDGNKLWSTSATAAKHVSFAQELGMKCGVVVLKDPCDTDPAECKISQLCEKATTDTGGTKSWGTGEAEGYVAVAKEYGLACGVVASSKIPESADNPICQKAVISLGGKIQWKHLKPANIMEAKKHGLTCGVGEKSDPSICNNSPIYCNETDLCRLVTLNSNPKRWNDAAAYQVHRKEATKRGITCGVKTDLRQAFISGQNSKGSNFSTPSRSSTSTPTV